MKKKKQNNIGEFDLNLEFDLCSAAHKLELEIEPGDRLYSPWLHREFWEDQDLNQETNQETNQEDEARTKQGEFTLEQRTNNGEIRFNREGTERKNTIEAVKKKLKLK